MTGTTQDDDLNKDNAFSEVIKNITRVNNVLQDLIKNYEKLQQIYHSQESIEQHEYGSQEENSSRYGNNKRSKDIATSGKPKDFPGTNIPFSELEDSAEVESQDDNKITEKSDEDRVPTVEALKQDRIKKKKVKAPKVKRAKPFEPVVVTYSAEITDEKVVSEKKKPSGLKDIGDQPQLNILRMKESTERTQAKLQAEQEVVLDHRSEKRPSQNASDVKSVLITVASNLTTKKVSSTLRNVKKKYERGDGADSENEVYYKQRKRLDDNDNVFYEESKGDKDKPPPKLRSKYLQTKVKKLASNVTVKLSTKKKEKEKSSLKGSLKPRSQILEDQKEDRKKGNQKEGTQKESSQKESKQKGNEHENEGSSEDEKSIKKEQFKTSILRKAYGDACLKVVVKKCYKACKSTLKRGCKMYKCKSNFQLQFKEHSRTGCIREFREAKRPNTSTNLPSVVVPLEPDVGPLKTGVDKVNVRAEKYTDINMDGFSDLTRNGYLAAACLPKTRRTDPAPGNSDRQLNILRDRFERECQKVSCSKCFKACSYAVDQTCSTHNCVSEKKKALKKQCKKECNESYSSKSYRNKKDRSSRDDPSDSSRETKHKDSDSSATSGSGTDSSAEDAESKSKENEATTVNINKTLHYVTKRDETMRMRAGDKGKDGPVLKLRLDVTKS